MKYLPIDYDIANHAFVVYKSHNRYIWFETGMKRYNGIFSYSSMEELFHDLAVSYSENKKVNIKKDCIFLYTKDYEMPEVGTKAYGMIQYTYKNFTYIYGNKRAYERLKIERE